MGVSKREVMISGITSFSRTFVMVFVIIRIHNDSNWRRYDSRISDSVLVAFTSPSAWEKAYIWKGNKTE